MREPNLLPIGAPYQIQAINALNWYVNEDGSEGKVVCSAVHDDPYGEAGQEGLDFAAEELGFELAVTARFNADRHATSPRRSAAPERRAARWCSSTATPLDCGRRDGQGGGGRLRSAVDRPVADLDSGAVPQPRQRRYLQANFILASEGTTWGDTSVEGMAQMIEHQTAYAPDQAPDMYFVFGYAEAWAVHQVLEAAVEQGDLSREGVIAAMESLETIELGDLLGDYEYGPASDRNPPRATTLFNIDPASPGGLVALEVGIESDAAGAFVFAE